MLEKEHMKVDELRTQKETKTKEQQEEARAPSHQMMSYRIKY